MCGVDFNHAKTTSIEVREDGRGEITGVKIGCVCENGDHAWTLHITQEKGAAFSYLQLSHSDLPHPDQQLNGR